MENAIYANKGTATRMGSVYHHLLEMFLTLDN